MGKVIPFGTAGSPTRVIVEYTITPARTAEQPDLTIVTALIRDSEDNISHFVMPANLAALLGHELIKASRFAGA